MSFNPHWNNGASWRNFDLNSSTWRPYANQSGGGALRQPLLHHPNHRNGWNSWMADPYFARSTQGQMHLQNYEKNRMHMFHQPQPVSHPFPANPTNPDFAHQKLLRSSHVPGLQTGQQIRDNIQKRKRARRRDENGLNIAKLNVRVTVSSEKIELRWEPTELKRSVKYEIICTNLKTQASKTHEKSPTSLFYDVKVIAGEIYRIHINCIIQNTNELIADWHKEIRAEFNYTELKQLYMNCLNFLNKGNKETAMHEFWVLYRCKPKVYWDEIHHYCNDVMQKYIKDDNGQPANLINGKINGLFFSARLNPDLTLPQSSPFGNVRMVVDFLHLLHPARHNFYFADFYCNKNMHYVTVVICHKESETDRYCNEKLMKLNPLNNPFVKLVPPQNPFESWKCFVNYLLWVELYYTEDVELNIGQFSAIMATGAGTSRIGGLPNNKYCELCNLYPRRMSPSTSSTLLFEEEVPKETVFKLEENDKNYESMKDILKLGKNVDLDVAQTLCDVLDKVEEMSVGTDELIEKLDARLKNEVEKMNKEIQMSKKTPNQNKLGSIAEELTGFIEQFSRRRDDVISKFKKLKEES